MGFLSKFKCIFVKCLPGDRASVVTKMLLQNKGIYPGHGAETSAARSWPWP